MTDSLAIIQHLAEAGPLTVGEAARHMARSQAAMSELIARLVKRGMLDRMNDARDRRRVLIWLTAEGRNMLNTAREVLSRERLARSLEAMPGAARSRLIESMQDLLDANAKGEGDE